MRCPSCMSDDVMAASMLWEQDTSLLKTRSISEGAMVGGRSVMVGVAAGATTGTQSSLLAQRFAPPARRGSFWTFIGWLLVAETVAGIAAQQVAAAAAPALVLAAFVLAIVLTARSAKKKRIKWEAQLDQWRQTWLCRRCGHSDQRPTFEPVVRMGAVATPYQVEAGAPAPALPSA